MLKSPKNHTRPVKREWIKPLSQGDGPRYKQIVKMVIAAIDEGRLLPGDRLPPQRELADMLKVDLTTVTRAYKDIKEKGLTQAATGRGSYLCYQPDSHSHVDLSMNTPPGSIKILPLISESIERLQHTTDAGSLMSYHVGAGSQAERMAAVKWLQPLLGMFSSERVVVSPGAQTAISILLNLLTRVGDTVITDTLTYPGFIAAARQFNRRIVTVESDKYGIIPDKLEAACTQHKAKLIYLNPTIHNPTAITIPAERRKDIAECLKRHNLILIEDDPYGLLPSVIEKPIANYAPENTYYISTISKCLSPGLRVAWIITPLTPSLEQVVNALRSTILVSNPLMLSVVTDWINSGIAYTLLNELKQENLKRQNLAKSILNGNIQSDTYGLHLWLEDMRPFDSQSIVQSAAQVGLGITPSHVFSPDGVAANGIRVSLGGARTLEQLSDALKRLNKVISDKNSYGSQNMINGIV
ncbi:PLP-dependent aminotransferase family protein [Pantoea sp. App145]|uniref:aminotransferase-like domain-containing protein n=1 Tax=Pantoea sp. App145 TaxID=3071567 RepID=UPI003A8058F5